MSEAEQLGLFRDDVEYVDGIPFKNPDSEEEARINNPDRKNLRYETAKWIKANPNTANLFLRFARQMAERRRLFGVKQLAERIRWECIFERGEDYKINNNYPAYIARWIIAKEPWIEEFIRFRKVRY